MEKSKIRYICGEYLNLSLLVIAYILVGIATNGCSSSSTGDSSASQTSAQNYLYVASGACYSGSNTTFTNLTASNMVYRLNLNTGVKDTLFADYWMLPASNGDSPVSIQNMDNRYMYVLVENSTTASLRRIEKIDKLNFNSRQIFSNNITALSAQLRDMFMTSSGDLLVSKSSAIEYLTGSNARIGAPFISASAAPCNTSTTLITKMIQLKNGKIIFLHAAAGQNRIGVFDSLGGTTCLASQSAPSANAYPTAAFYDNSSARVIVAYAGNATATDLNCIYSYSVDESTGAISDPQKIYDVSQYPSIYPYLLYGISEMAYDPLTKSVYIATANNTTSTISNYAIEKFSYSSSNIGIDNTKVLLRNGNSAFYSYGSDTKCISKMVISN